MYSQYYPSYTEYGTTWIYDTTLRYRNSTSNSCSCSLLSSSYYKEYNFKIGDVVTLDGAPRYTALVNNEVDVVDAFATDGLLKKFNLKILNDDKGFFPPYYAMPIISSEKLEEFPEIEGVLEELGEVLTNEVMMELNYKVDELQESPSKVAKDFLESKGMI